MKTSVSLVVEELIAFASSKQSKAKLYVTVTCIWVLERCILHDALPCILMKSCAALRWILQITPNYLQDECPDGNSTGFDLTVWNLGQTGFVHRLTNYSFYYTESETARSVFSERIVRLGFYGLGWHEVVPWMCAWVWSSMRFTR